MENERPYKFPEECPQREKKADNGIIIDVVENEIKTNPIGDTDQNENDK